MNPTSDAIPDATWEKFVASVEPPAEPAVVAPVAELVAEPAAVTPAEVPAVESAPAPVVAPPAVAPAMPDLLESVAALDDAGRAKLREVLGVKPEPPAAPVEPPKFAPSAEVAEMLASTDPDAIATGKILAKVEERAWKAEQRAEAAEAQAKQVGDAAFEAKVDKALNQLEADCDAVQQSYVIDDKPVTDDHLDAVAAFMKENPTVARTLSVEQVLRAMYPSARQAPAPTGRTPGSGTPVALAPPAPASQPPATIVPAGSAGGMTPGPDAKPRAGMTMEEAVARGMEAHFGVRGRTITHT